MDAVAILGGSLALGGIGALLHKLYRFNPKEEVSSVDDINAMKKQLGQARLERGKALSALNINTSLLSVIVDKRDAFERQLIKSADQVRECHDELQELKRKVYLARDEAFRLTGCTNIALSQGFIDTFGDLVSRSEPKVTFRKSHRKWGEHSGELMLIIRDVYVDDKKWGHIVRKETYLTDRLNPHYICKYGHCDFENPIMGYRATEKQIKKRIKDDKVLSVVFDKQQPPIVLGTLKTFHDNMVIEIKKDEFNRIGGDSNFIHPKQVMHDNVLYSVLSYGKWFAAGGDANHMYHMYRYMYVESRASVVNGELKKSAKGETVIKINKTEYDRIGSNKAVFPKQVMHNNTIYSLRRFGQWFADGGDTNQHMYRYMYVERLGSNQSWEEHRSAAINSMV